MTEYNFPGKIDFEFNDEQYFIGPCGHRLVPVKSEYNGQNGNPAQCFGCVICYPELKAL